MSTSLQSPSTSEQADLASLEKTLLQLQSQELDERMDAFNRLRTTPKSLLDLAYKTFRQRTPDYGWELDCLERLEVEFPDPTIVCGRCICTVISPGYEAMLEAMLDTLIAYGQSPEARIVVFAIDGSFEALAHRSEITRIRCRSSQRLSAAVKGAVYSAARFIQADYFLTLEADMLIVGSLQPLWAAIEVARSGTIMGIRPTGLNPQFDIKTLMVSGRAKDSDLEFICGSAKFNSPHWFNGGVLLGDQRAFLDVDTQMRRLAPYSILWLEGGSNLAWADELLVMVCLGLLNNAAEIDLNFNQVVNCYSRDPCIQTARTPGGFQYRSGGSQSKVMHFVSGSRDVMWEIKAEIEDHGLLEN